MSPARKLSDQRLFTLLMLSTHFVLLVFGAQTRRLSSGIVVGSAKIIIVSGPILTISAMRWTSCLSDSKL